MRDATLAEWLADGDDDLPADLVDGAPPDERPGGEEPSGRRGRRASRFRLWTAAGLAWALVAVVWVAASSGSPGQPRVEADPGGEASPGAEALPGGEVDPGDEVVGAGSGGAPASGAGAPGAPASGGAAGSGAHGAEAGGGGGGSGATAGEPGPAGTSGVEIAAAAVLAVRQALTHDDERGWARYVDLAVPAGMRWHGDLAVVTVDAVVYEGDEDGWGAPRAVRYAQPVSSTAAGPRAAGRPWPLPVPDRSAEPPGLLPLHDPEAAGTAEAALTAAGYDEVEVLALARPDGLSGIVVADVEARAPGSPRRGDHQVWISEEAGAVLGAAPAPEEHAREGES